MDSSCQVLRASPPPVGREQVPCTVPPEWEEGSERFCPPCRQRQKYGGQRGDISRIATAERTEGALESWPHSSPPWVQTVPNLYCTEVPSSWLEGTFQRSPSCLEIGLALFPHLPRWIPPGSWNHFLEHSPPPWSLPEGDSSLGCQFCPSSWRANERKDFRGERMAVVRGLAELFFPGDSPNTPN